MYNGEKPNFSNKLHMCFEAVNSLELQGIFQIQMCTYVVNACCYNMWSSTTTYSHVQCVKSTLKLNAMTLCIPREL